MSRSLPVEMPADEAGHADKAVAAETSLTGSVAVYDPAMCCPTGICGPGVDPALLVIARDLRWLEKHGVTVERFGLAREASAFSANPKVSGLMHAFGDGALPAVLVNGNVLCYGRYPSRDELSSVLAQPRATPAVAGPAASAAPCCTPGSGCC